MPIMNKKSISTFEREMKNTKFKKAFEKSYKELLLSEFEKLDAKFTKAGALLKGLRLRDGLSQIEFAKKN